MAKSLKPIRLSKAAQEFNISTGTIVTYLNKKGFDIATNPNTKLTPEMYELLLKEYSREKSVKEVVKRQIEQQQNPKKDPDSPEYEGETEEPVVEVMADEEQVETILIKNVQFHVEKEEPVEVVDAPIENKKSEEKLSPATDVEEELVSPIRKPVIVGKMDLSSIDVKKEKTPIKKEKEEVAQKPEEQKNVDVDPQEEKVIVSPEPKAEMAPEIKEEEKLPVETKDKEIESEEIKQEAVIVPEVTVEVVTQQPEEVIPPVKDQKIESPVPVSDVEIAPQKSIEQPVPEKQQEEEVVPIAEEKQTPKEPVVVEAPIEKPEDKKAEPKKSSSVEDENFLATEVRKLEGPTILGTMVLEEKPKRTDKKRPSFIKKADADKAAADKASTAEDKKKPIATSSDNTSVNKKRKRKRITLSTSAPQGDKAKAPQQGGPVPKLQTDKTGSRGGVKKPVRKPRVIHQEPSEEEVQKQIKETLSRLSGSVGKSKSAKYRKTKREADRVRRHNEGAESDKRIIKVTEFVTVNELATMMDVKVNDVISTCMMLGLFVSINMRLDAETINVLAEEFGYEVEFVSADLQEALLKSESVDDNETEAVERAPIVTVMGHVDHGKTSLLDFIRKANVIGGEAGGITQHIGAYDVELADGRHITFLDTPGHEAFTAMRARGAKVTDVAIIIIAADDRIMPQTIEAINHAQAASVPIVFAINKIDLPKSDANRIKEELAQKNLLVEEWGGKYQSQDIAAKIGTGVPELLDKVLLEAEMLDLKGFPSRSAKGTVIESLLDKGRGYVSKVLVQDGTLKKGDYVLAGSYSGKVKAMYNERNQQVEEAGPSKPVLVLGLDGAPQAGDQFNVLIDEREAKDIANKRRQLQRELGIRTQKHVTLDEIGRRIAIGDFKELNVIVKGDVDGSVEALSDSLLRLSTDEVQLNVIHKSVGQISESDVSLASASDAIIVGFQVRPSLKARRLAEQDQIDIRTYSVIYKAIEEVKSAIEGLLSPDIEERILCNVEVREVFKISKVGTIAGCMVLDGVITRNTKIRIIRDGIVIYTGGLGSLKRYKDDVKEVKTNFECGLNIDNFNDIKVGDIIEGFEEVKIARKLD